MVDNNHFSISFADFVSNPYLISLQQAIQELLPHLYWWYSDAQLTRYPFPTMASKTECEHLESIGSQSKAICDSAPPEIRDVLNSQYKVLITGCCAERKQGFAPFFFRQQFIGGIGICGFDNEEEELVRKILVTIEGYFTLLASSLEDHDDLELMHSIWAETITVVDLDSLLHRLANELCHILNVPKALIFLLNEDGEFYPAHVKGYSQDILKRRDLHVTRYDYAEPPASHISNAVRRLNADDPLREWLLKSLRDENNYTDEQEAFAIPFYRNTVLIGLFATLEMPPSSLSMLKRSLVRLLVTGGAAAIDNALTLERMKKRRKALSTIHTVHRLMSSTATVEEILPRIGQQTRQLLQAKKCSIMLCDESKEMLLPAIAIGMEENEVGQQPLALGEELPGWVAENFNPVIYRPATDPAPPWQPKGDQYPAESYLSVSLFDTDIEGVITVADTPNDFNPGDREILVTFAEQVVLAIQNARAHEGERTITVNALKSIANLIETHDPAIAGITSHTCEWARRIARAMRLPDQDIQKITYASLLHETGMLRTFEQDVTYEHLRKKGPQLAMRVVESLGLSEAVGHMVYHVNEAWNGEGFPDGLAKDAIPLGSRIINLANAYATLLIRHGAIDKMTKVDFLQAFRVLSRLRDRAFDPQLVDILGQLIRESNEADLRKA